MKSNLIITVSGVLLFAKLGTTKLPPLADGGHWDIYPCHEWFPDDECYHASKHCFKPYDWKRSIDVGNITSDYALPNELRTDSEAHTFETFLPCEHLLGSSHPLYEQCLAVKNSPTVFTTLLGVPGSISLQSKSVGDADGSEPASGNKTPGTLDGPGVNEVVRGKKRGQAPKEKHCCVLSNSCFDYMRARTRKEPWTPKDGIVYKKTTCCLGMWILSCGGHPPAWPETFHRPPRCSNPKGHESGY